MTLPFDPELNRATTEGLRVSSVRLLLHRVGWIRPGEARPLLAIQASMLKQTSARLAHIGSRFAQVFMLLWYYRVQLGMHDYALLGGRLVSCADKNSGCRAAIDRDMGHASRDEEVVAWMRLLAMLESVTCP